MNTNRSEIVCTASDIRVIDPEIKPAINSTIINMNTIIFTASN